MVERAYWRRAETQFGVVRHEGESVLSDRQVRYRVKQGRWHRLMPGVFRLAGAPPSWEGELLAAALWAGSTAVVSHRSAARLHGFSVFAKTKALELTSTTPRRSSRVKVHEVKSFSFHDRVSSRCQHFTVTTVARTLLDLAPLCDERELATCLDEALSRKQVTLEELERVLGRAKGRRGVRLLRAVVASRSGANGPTESDLERVALSVIEESRLPKPTVQRRVALGRRRARLDCSYPAQGVVVECDGYAFHSDVRAFERDRQRINALTARGVVVLRWTWAALHERPQELTDELRAVLLSRSR